MVAKSSIIWGIISGLSLAFYTIYVGNLLKISVSSRRWMVNAYIWHIYQF